MAVAAIIALVSSKMSSPFTAYLALILEGIRRPLDLAAVIESGQTVVVESHQLGHHAFGIAAESFLEQFGEFFD